MSTLTLHDKIELAHRIARNGHLRIAQWGTQDKPKWILYNQYGQIGYRTTIDAMLRLVKMSTGYKNDKTKN